MTQTFDIRFARSAGLAALMEVPGNAFRWKGGGHLEIDTRGISIGVKRGLLALLGGKRTHRIPTEQLRAVYREGDALRVEYQSETARVVLPFWAGDRDTAAQIVRLLPTSQTVEIEESTHFPKPSADWRMFSSLGVALAALVIGSWAIHQRNNPVVLPETASINDAVARADASAPTPTPAAAMQTDAAQDVETPANPASPKPWYEAPAIPLDPSRPAHTYSAGPSAKPVDQTTLPDSAAEIAVGDQAAVMNTQGADPTRRTWEVRATSEGIVPYMPGMPEYAAARRQLDLFLAEANTLRGNSNSDGWWKVTERISNSPDFEDPRLKPLQTLELAVSAAWRRASSMPAASFTAEIEFAEMLEARASRFVQ